MNQLFCDMHAIIGLGTVCKEAQKEFETVAASVLTTSGFNKGNAQSYDILWEISKTFTTGHEYQKAGVVHFFDPYLQERGVKNQLVLFHGERINILFVIAAAAYYHREHILHFLDYHCVQSNKLLSAIKDIKENLFVACFQTLGILGKLITHPLLHLVQEPNTHISLNDTWFHVITKLESFATNAHPLMEGLEVVLNGRVTKNEIYEELMRMKNLMNLQKNA